MSDVGHMDHVPNRAARRAAERRSKRLGAAASAGALASGTAAAVVGLFGGTAGAVQTYVVDAGGDAGNNACEGVVAGDCTLRDAVEDANNDGEESIINFAANVTGTIVLTDDLDFDEAFDATVNGPGAGVLTIDGDADHHLYAGSSFGANTLSISGLTITNGYASQVGGGIAFYANDGNLVLTDMVITGNHAEYYGGGIYFYGSNDLTVDRSTISNNTTDYSFGGGILFGASNNFVMTNSTVSGNTAGLNSGGYGGGIFMYTGEGSGANSATIANSTIANNTAIDGSGGGIALYSNDLTLLQATISGNTAGNLGDGLYLASYVPPASVSAKSDRPERDRGEGKEPKPARARDGVSAQEAGAVSIVGTIVSANPGNNIDTGGTVTVDSTSNLIGAVGSGITLNDLGGTITSDNPGLGALADNGGPTQTMALQTGSAAIDTGPATVPTFTGNEFDQRRDGFPRVVSGRVDIGAYEVQLVVLFTG